MIQKYSAHLTNIQRYYKFHSIIYDTTRWSFLFGRQRILSDLPDLRPRPRILEIGCGTGMNIQYLEYLFPDATIVGMDISHDMLDKARQKTGDSKQVKLIQCRYGHGETAQKPFDLILLSYSMTMIGESTDDILQQVHEDLSPNGYVGVVDFHSTPFRWFRRWMSKNHVEIDGTNLSLLRKYFSEEQVSVQRAYFGLWKYFIFLGKRI